MKIFHSIRTAALAALAFVTIHSAQAVITGFDDIQFWAGSGSNQAAIVIDWNDGVSPVSLAWGFRWDGMATGQDMLLALAGSISGGTFPTGADSNLSIELESYSWGYAVTRIAYTGEGYTHDQGGFGASTDGYWEYYCVGGTFETEDGENTASGSASYPGTGASPNWVSSWTGFTDRVLADGSWDGWSFAVNFTSAGVDQPIAAVPEPSTMVLLGLGTFAVIIGRRYVRAKS